jgi:beta-glucosidase-like glycosyl hydrolase
VDRAVVRVLRQKSQLGLRDRTFDDEPTTEIDLDPAGHRKIAARLAQESVVLLTNDGCSRRGPQQDRHHWPERRPGQGLVRLLLLH